MTPLRHIANAVSTAAVLLSSMMTTAANASDQVLERFRSAYLERCATARADGHVEPQPPDNYEIRFRYHYEGADDPDHKLTLVRVLCDRGAYNEIFVFFAVDASGEITPLQFAEPELRISYENDDFEGAVKDIRIVGMAAKDMLVNAFYDPATRSITSHSKWRGLGDASSSGTWRFTNGRFVLELYDVDPTYDGEINSREIIRYTENDG